MDQTKWWFKFSKNEIFKIFSANKWIYWRIIYKLIEKNSIGQLASGHDTRRLYTVLEYHVTYKIFPFFMHGLWKF